MAWFAGSVQGVVVQITALASFAPIFAAASSPSLNAT